ARSLRLGPGDEVLATDHEYGACDRTWRFLAAKHGITYINQPIPVPIQSPQHIIEALWQGVTPRTRVIYLSHIASPTALIFPVEQICARARQAGILTVIDGAHAPGHIPLALDALGADFYTGNLHKWLCAPKGAAFLYARPEVQPLLEPLVVSWGWQPEQPGASPFIDQNEWIGTRDIAAFLSVPDAIQFQKDHRWDVVSAACHRLLADFWPQLLAVTGQGAFYPNSDDYYRQMAAFPLPPHADLAALKTRLYDDYRIEVPLIAWNGYKLIRISVQGYNTRRDLTRLLTALKALL
ncbi:MAG: aminotransferase class V-fold PLP-dependent enzyme, partial [Anaerolineales bacterium]